jgi:hypothetical protein
MVAMFHRQNSALGFAFDHCLALGCHAEYPAVPISRKLLSSPPPNQCELLPHHEAANQSRCLPTRFK